MPKQASVHSSKKAIERHFKSQKWKVFTRADMNQVLLEHRGDWNLPQSFSTSQLISFLQEQGGLQAIVLSSPKYKDVIRYSWGEATSLFDLALSIRNNAYLCYSTAAFLLNLTEQIPTTIHVNYEQSSKPSGGNLSQGSIDRAFASKQRVSNLIYSFGDAKIVMLSGKSTENLEVGEVIGPLGESLLATKLERTLIDMVVRPVYAGGLPLVIEAYRKAKDRASVNVLCATLRKLNYVYPYQQAIGFVMERAGYEQERFQMLLDMGTPFDFYLDYQIREKDYDPKWRLFFPKGL